MGNEKNENERAVSPAESVHDVSDLINMHFSYGRVYGEDAAQYYATHSEIKEFAAALLVQPLQQEGGKEVPDRINLKHGAYITRETKTSGENGWLLRNEHGLVRALNGYECEFVDCALAAALLPVATPSKEWLEKLEYIFRRIDTFRLRMSYNDSYFGEPAGLLKGCVAEMAHLFDGYHRLAAPQPSDNLQQASTSQEPTVTPEMQAVVDGIRDQVERSGEKIARLREKYGIPASATPAQATPEGAQDEAGFEEWYAFGGGKKLERNFTQEVTVAAREAWKAGRSAFATQQKVIKPVGLFIMGGAAWVATSSDDPRGVPLYRAAPPQQTGKIVAWCEPDGEEWIVYGADSEVGQHIAQYQTKDHGIRVFPIYGYQQVDESGVPG